MENFAYAKEGDMALVTNIQPITYIKAGDVITSITLVDEFKLPSEITETLTLNNFFTGSFFTGNMFGNIEINSNNAMVYIYATQTSYVLYTYTNINGKYVLTSKPDDGVICTLSTMGISFQIGLVQCNTVYFQYNVSTNSNVTPIECTISNEFTDTYKYFFEPENNSTLTGLYTSINNTYVGSSTQLNATKEYIYNANFIGANSVVEVGELQVVTNLTNNQIRLRRNIYNLYNTLYVSDASKLYATSDITTINMQDLDTTYLTNTQNMFGFCKNITIIPNFDTTNVVNMSNFAHFCYNLATVPEFNTVNVTDMSRMFYACNNLSSVPQFDSSSVTNMTNMFYNCVNLSATSYENIANMLPQANNLPNQYLSNIGLDANNFTKNQINMLNSKGYLDAIPITVQSYYTIKWE